MYAGREGDRLSGPVVSPASRGYSSPEMVGRTIMRKLLPLSVTPRGDRWRASVANTVPRTDIASGLSRPCAHMTRPATSSTATNNRKDELRNTTGSVHGGVSFLRERSPRLAGEIDAISRYVPSSGPRHDSQASAEADANAARVGEISELLRRDLSRVD